MVTSGDFNFVERAEDTSNPSWRASEKVAAAWNSYTSKHKLLEVSQPAHTFLSHPSSNEGKLKSSRLDRHYTTMTEAEKQVDPTTAKVIRTPHSMLGTEVSELRVGHQRDHGPCARASLPSP